MVDYFFFIFCFLSIIDIKIKGSNNFFEEYMHLDNTNSIKGIFVWLIVFCHKTKYINKKDYLFVNITNHIGQQVVSMFLFYSGYGIFESFKKKGNNYINTLPKKGFVLFLKTQIIIFINLLLFKYFFNIKITIKKYLLCMIFKSSLENSNWFPFTIILFYNYSFISFRFIKNKNFIGIIIISFICFSHILWVYNYYFPKAFFPVNTVLCFVIGFYYSYFKLNFDKILMRNDIYYFGIISLIIIFYFKVFIYHNLISLSFRNCSFALLVILISMKVKFNNEFLKFLNYHSYSIYLLHRIVMSYNKRFNCFKNNDFIQVSFEFTSIFFFSSLFDKYTIFLYRLMNINLKPIKNNNQINDRTYIFRNIIYKSGADIIES